jgi:hypothetical protein
MSITTWSPGTVYVPGALVFPRSVDGAAATTIPNADFESGDSGWTKGTGWAINTNLAFAGSYSAEFTGSGTDTLIHSTKHAISPGKAITANCFVHQGAAADDVATAAVTLTWYTSADAVISTSTGNTISTGDVGVWFKSTVSATAPATAAKVSIGCTATSDGTALNVDNFSWNYVTGVAATGLAYKAVQAEAGTSGAQEPTWPTVVGNQVVDNEVTWEAVITGSVTWEASSVLTSGTDEPTWPTVAGAYVSDNNIAWETTPLRITDDNCPHSTVVAIAASKVFAGDTDVVRFCTTLNARDWSTAEDAGFIPSGLQQESQVGVDAMGVYRGNLGIWSGSTFQVWQVDPDPASMNLLDAMEGVGSVWHQAVQPVSDDLFFLASPGWVRSVAIAAGTNNLATGDVGKPIDVLIKPEAEADNIEPIATYYPGAGQYWLAFRPGTDGEGDGNGNGNGGNGGNGFSDYEYLLLVDEGSVHVQYLGVDMLTDTVTYFGSYPETSSVITDGTFTFSPSGSLNVDQYIWRGNAFSLVFTGAHGGSNDSEYMLRLQDHDDFFIVTGVGSFEHGFRYVEYATGAPYSFPSTASITATSDYWAATVDLRFANNGLAEYGDALVTCPQNGNTMYAYQIVADVPTERGSIAGVGSLGNSSAYGWDRDSGLIATHFSAATNFDLYQVDMTDLNTITKIGNVGPTLQDIFAVGIAPNGVIVTVEGSGSGDKIRTYTRSNTTLTAANEVAMPASTNSNCRIETSPYTNRVWVITASGNAGIFALTIGDAAEITVDFSTTGLSSSASFDKKIAFLDGPLATTTNGFTGIKQKLYEHWSMNETGSITRVGSMTNQNLAVTGTVTDRAGKTANAADFDGASRLGASTVPIELSGTGTFSFCMDVLFDSVATNSQLLARGRTNANSNDEQDYGCFLWTTTGLIEVYVVVGSTVYRAQCAEITPTTGTWYHVYGEYNLSENKVKIRVNNGTLYETTVVGNINTNASGAWRLGQQSTAGGWQNYLNGGIDNVFWFYDALDTDQQTYMYNSGNSRTFAEL